ncbi:MAG TPA: hypothetical protein VFL75_03795 [Candidatus Limnocylindria bacterium]|nr:hypothetical protein [Candidatus Limnocylindria bacterium]
MEGVCAIGRVSDDGPWIGFQPGPAGYRVVAGRGPVIRGRTADANVLLALAIAWFEEAFDDPPPELEASQADLSALVRHVAAGEQVADRRHLLAEAVDAIDDGLAGDAVANRLSAVRSASDETNEQADPIDLLVTLAEELLQD